jgi:hypothetical protein
MWLDALLARLSGAGGAVTPVTSPLAADVTAKPAPLLVCTPVTPVTSSADVTASKAHSSRWLLHFADGEPLPVTFEPAATHDEVLSRYPDALAAVPVSDPPLWLLPSHVADMFSRAVEAGLYAEEERTVFAAMFRCDADEARQLLEAARWRIGQCDRCRHRASPGLSDGYCSAREDLPPVYGLMHSLPANGGADCGQFELRDRPATNRNLPAW